MNISMENSDSEPLGQYEQHYETLLARVRRRRSLTHEMDWLFHGSNTLRVVPDYLEFHTVGHNRLEQICNRAMFRASRGVWSRLFWPKIRGGLLSYIREIYFPIFFEKSARTPQIEAAQKAALGRVESFMDRQWDDLGLCTFYELGVMVNEVLKSCYAYLGCPEDIFAGDKKWQNRVALDLAGKHHTALRAHPDALAALVYGACQSNWIDSLEGDASQIPRVMDEDFGRMTSDPASLAGLAGESPYYQIERFRALVSGGPRNILFECDNCGEVVFDLLLIQHLLEMGHRVVLGAKERPALNDATVRDVEGLLGLELFAPLGPALADGRLSLLPIASVIGGKLLYEASEAYQRAYARADLLVLKGQGNFQTMPMGVGGGRFTPYRYKKPMVFLMPVKSVMSRLCLGSILPRRPPDRSLFLYCYDPFDATTYPRGE